MMEIRHISGNTRCLVGHQMIPLYMTDSSHCIMLDTGSQSMREEIVQTLEDAGITPIGLLCTHTHFDHFGNANFFSQRYQCPVALPLGEAEICRTPASVKSYLAVFSMGQILSDAKRSAIPCMVDHVIRPEEKDTMFRGVIFKVLHTPGHSMDHVCYITPDNVCYGGDALMCGHSLEVAKLPFAFQIRQSIQSMELFRNLNCASIVLAHKGVVEAPFDTLVEDNKRVTLEQLARVAAVVDRQMTTVEINAAVRKAMGIHVASVEKALNLECFLRPYLECLIDDGTLRQTLRSDGALCYEPAAAPSLTHCNT